MLAVFPFFALLALLADLSPATTQVRRGRIPLLYPIILLHRILTQSTQAQNGKKRHASRWAPTRSSLSAPFAALGRGGAARVVGRILSSTEPSYTPPPYSAQGYTPTSSATPTPTYRAPPRVYAAPVRSNTGPAGGHYPRHTPGSERWGVYTASPLSTPTGWRSLSPAPPMTPTQSTPSTPGRPPPLRSSSTGYVPPGVSRSVPRPSPLQGSGTAPSAELWLSGDETAHIPGTSSAVAPSAHGLNRRSGSVSIPL